MIRRQFMKKQGQPIMPMLGGYVAAFLAALVFIAIAAAIEAYISPLLMKSIVESIHS
ncbi:hypothetical protein D3C84_1233780 [compost metagenome]